MEDCRSEYSYSTVLPKYGTPPVLRHACHETWDECEPEGRNMSATWRSCENQKGSVLYSTVNVERQEAEGG